LRNTIVLLTALFVAMACSSQTDKPKTDAASGQAWKEYVYRSDGFAITVPEAPNRHPDANYPDTTAYTAAGTTLRVMQMPKGCDFVISEQVRKLEELKNGTRKLNPSESQFKLNLSSVKHGTVEGFPFLEFEQVVPSGSQSYEHWSCAHKRLYIFAAHWQPAQTKPAYIDKIVRSFRLLKP
jgi:hypothetical protein